MVISIPTALPLAKQPEARFPVHPTTTRPAYGNPLPAWGVVEAIVIKMDEKSVQFLPGEVVNRFARSSHDAHFAPGGKIDRLEFPW